MQMLDGHTSYEVLARLTVLVIMIMIRKERRCGL